MKTKKNFLKKLTAGILGFVMTLGVGAAGYAGVASEVRADSYTITFKTGSGDGISASTSTACSTVVSDGSDYLSGNLVTASSVYHSGGSGLKLGASKSAGTIKMNLSDSGKVTATSVVVNAKLYNSSKAATLKVNGSATQNLEADFKNFTFNLSNSDISYLELASSKYCWIKSVVVNYSAAPAKTLTGLEIASQGSVKKSYSAGESFNPSGLVVYASWDNVKDTSNNVVSDIVWSPDPLTKGTTQVIGYHKKDSSEAYSISVSDIVVSGPDATITSSNWGVTTTTKPTTETPVQAKIEGIKYQSGYGYVYNGNMSMNPSYNGYFGNIEAYNKYIDKVVFKFADTNAQGRANVYASNSSLGTTNTVTGSADGTVVTYDMSTYKAQYWSIKQKTTGSNNYINIKQIDVYLGDDIDIFADGVEIYSTDLTIENKVISLNVGDSEGTVMGTLGATVTPSDATNKNVTWVASDEEAIIIEDDGSVLIDTEEAGIYTITAYADGAEEILSVYDEITVEVIDTSMPVLEGVTVGGTAVTPQYAGKEFNYSNLTFTPVYDRDVSEEDMDVIDPSTLNWGTLEVGVNPSATYSSEKYSGTVTIVVTGVSPIADFVTDIEICGTMTKTTYNTTEDWSSDGLTVKGHYASDSGSLVEITEGVALSFDPAKPSLDTEKVTVTASYLELESNPVQFNVTVEEKQYASGIVDGAQYIIEATYSKDSTTKGPFVLPRGHYGDAPAGVMGSGTSFANDVTKAWTFTSTGVDDEWFIHYFDDDEQKEYYLYHTTSNNGVRSNTEAYADDNGYKFEATLVGETKLELHLKDTKNSRYLTAYSSPDFRCYTSTTSQGANSSIIKLTKYEAPATYDSLEVTATKTSGWEVGDEPSLDDLGATVKAVYSSGDKKTVTDDAEITNGLPLVKGDNTLTISYTDTKLDVTNTTTLTVSAVQPVTGLSMNTYSGQMNFGQTQDLSVTITPDDANNKTIEWESSNTSIATVAVDATNSSKATVTAGTNVGDVTITAKTTDGSNKSVSASIHVNDPTVHVTGITISGTLQKTKYYAGSSFDATGLSVYTTVSSGSGVNVINEVTWSPEPLTDGTTTVTASYTCDDGTFTDTISGIEVSVKTLQSIEIVSEPTKTEYRQGDQNLDLTGLSVTAHYQYDDVEDIEGYTTSGYDLSQRGDQVVTVSYGGKTDTFNIHVSIPEIKVSYTTTGSLGYYEVTSVSDLSAGDKVVFGATTNSGTDSEKSFISTGWDHDTKSTKYWITSGDASVSDEGEITANKILYFVLSKSGNNWVFTDQNGIVLGADAAKQMQQGSGTQTWTISIDEGVTKVESTDTSFGWIQYNPSSPRFLNYTSAQSAMKLYKYKNSTTTNEFTVSEKLFDAVTNANTYFSFDSDGKISFASGKTWTNVISEFSSVESEQIGYLATAIGNSDGNIVEQFLVKYDRAVSHFGANNFLSRTVDIHEYDITLDYDNGSTGASAKATYNTEFDLSKHNPSKTGYDLTGWKDQNDNAYGKTDKPVITGDVTFTAQWAVTKYSLSYVTNGGTIKTGTGTAAGSYDYHTVINLPTVEKEHYDFDGWYTTSTFDTGTKVTSSFSIEADTTLYAKWAPKMYDITFKNEDGTITYETQTKQFAYDTTPSYTGSEPTKEKDNIYTYSFAGWSNSLGGDVTGLSKVTGNTTYYAVFTPTFREYSVTYDLNGGTGTAPTDSNTYHYNATAYAITPTAGSIKKDGYQFGGWSLDGQKVGEEGFTVNGNIKLEAIWLKEYTATFNLNGGSGSLSPIKFIEGETITLPSEPYYKAHEFNGWSDGINTYDPDQVLTAMPAGDVEFTAVWNSEAMKVTNPANLGAGVSFDYLQDDMTVNMIWNLKIRFTAQFNEEQLTLYGDPDVYDYGVVIMKTSELGGKTLPTVFDEYDCNVGNMKKYTESTKAASWSGLPSTNKDGVYEFGANLKFPEITQETVNEEYTIIFYAYNNETGVYYVTDQLTVSVADLLKAEMENLSPTSALYQVLDYIVKGGQVNE